MKVTTMILLIGCMHLSAASLSQTITLKAEKQPIEAIFDAIRQQTNYRVLYFDRVIDPDLRITVSANEMPLEAFLDEVLAPHQLSYKIGERTIMVRNDPTATHHAGLAAGEQEKTVSGKVTDDSGQPIEGVTVTVKGTSAGTKTDASGNYRITVPTEGTTLVFRILGFETAEQVIGSAGNIAVTLHASVSDLDEVVVVGYGTQRKATLTGAVSSVTGNEMAVTKNENVQNMLTGKVAGLRVVQNSAEPGKFNNDISIRGMGGPLIIIDGVPRDNMAQLDASDIESISVLKDASAAIYGVRAANGVVLITTKKGSMDNVDLSYSGNTGWQMPSGLPKPVDALGYMTLTNERTLHNVNGGTLTFLDDDFQAYYDGTKQSTDWYTPVIKEHVPQTQHNLSASGGNGKTNYFMSAGYMEQDGFLRSGDQNYKRYNVRSNIATKMTDRLKVDLNVSGIMDQTNSPFQGTDWIIRSFWRQKPTDPIYANNRDGYFLNTSVDGTNPVAMESADLTGYRRYQNKYFQSSLALTYDIPHVEGLSAKGFLSYDYTFVDNKIFQKAYDQYTYDAATDKYTTFTQQSPNSIRRENYTKDLTLWQASLNYSHVFGRKHNVTGLLMYEESVRNGDNFFAYRELAIPIDQLMAGNSLNQIGSMNTGDNDLYKDANQSVIGRANYAYDDKYLGEFSFRYDNSSKFPSNSRWKLFPSVSLGYRISKESFWKESFLDMFDDVKIRASYGEMGDDQSLRYQFLSGYLYPAAGDNNRLPGGYIFGGNFVNSSVSRGIPNPNITWYTAKTSDIGVDLSALQGKISFTFDYFQRLRDGLLSTRSLSLPGLVGASLPQENLNSDVTRGFELEIGHKNHMGDFMYAVKGNLSFSRTKNRYQERATAGNSYDNWRSNGNDRWQNTWWGKDAVGQYQSWNDIINSPTFVGRGALPGDYSYGDWNGDGIISDLDTHPINYTGLPMLNFGLTIDLAYKGFDFNALLQGSGMRYISYGEQLLEPLWGGGSGLDQFLDRWHPADPTADPYDPNIEWIPGNYAYTGSLPDVNSKYNMQNATYVRVKSIELGYTFSRNALKFIGLSSVRFYVNGYNLFTFTKLKYLDPEHPSDDNGYLYPLNKTMSLGVNVKF